MPIADLLEQFRIASRNDSPESLAPLFNTTRASWSRWCSGKNIPEEERAPHMAEVLRTRMPWVTTDYVLRCISLSRFQRMTGRSEEPTLPPGVEARLSAIEDRLDAIQRLIEDMGRERRPRR